MMIFILVKLFCASLTTDSKVTHYLLISDSDLRAPETALV